MTGELPWFYTYVRTKGMEVQKMTLKDLPIGKSATILSVGGEGALRQHFLDMGIIPKADITMVKYAPMGDPVEVRIHSYELTLRLSDAEKNRNRFYPGCHFPVRDAGSFL